MYNRRYINWGSLGGLLFLVLATVVTVNVTANPDAKQLLKSLAYVTPTYTESSSPPPPNNVPSPPNNLPSPPSPNTASSPPTTSPPTAGPRLCTSSGGCDLSQLALTTQPKPGELGYRYPNGDIAGFYRVGGKYYPVDQSTGGPSDDQVKNLLQTVVDQNKQYRVTNPGSTALERAEEITIPNTSAPTNTITQQDYNSCLASNTPSECSGILFHIGEQKVTKDQARASTIQSELQYGGNAESLLPELKKLADQGVIPKDKYDQALQNYQNSVYAKLREQGDSTTTSTYSLYNQAVNGNEAALSILQNTDPVKYNQALQVQSTRNLFSPETSLPPPVQALVDKYGDDLSLTQDPTTAATLASKLLDCYDRSGKSTCDAAFVEASKTNEPGVVFYKLDDPSANTAALVEQVNKDKATLFMLAVSAYGGYQLGVSGALPAAGDAATNIFLQAQNLISQAPSWVTPTVTFAGTLPALVQTAKCHFGICTAEEQARAQEAAFYTAVGLQQAQDLEIALNSQKTGPSLGEFVATKLDQLSDPFAGAKLYGYGNQINGLSEATNIIDNLNSDTNQLVRYVTGLDYTDPRLSETILNDISSINAKYSLPAREMRFYNPYEYKYQLDALAKSVDTQTLPAWTRQRLFDTGGVGGVFEESTNSIIIPNPRFDLYPENPVQALTNNASVQVHETVHALQNSRYPGMPIEVAEYEAYLSEISPTWVSKADPQDILDNIFGYRIGGSVSWWYKNQGLTPEWLLH